MKRIWIILFLLPTALFCQFGEVISKGAASLGMAGSDILLSNIQSIHTNQAGLTSIKSLEAQVTAQQWYGISELIDGSLGVALPAGKFGVVGLSVSSYGVKSYSEQSFGLVYARDLSRHLAIGAKVGMFNLRIDQYGSTLSPNFEIGMRSTLLEPFVLAAHVRSPVRTRITSTTDIPTHLSLAIGYQPSKKLITTLEASTYIDGKPNVSLGIDYRIIEMLSLRFGAATQPGIVSGGFALHFMERIHIEGSVSSHQTLGITPGISVVYGLDSSED